jgi:hypothetical protein
VPVQSDPRILLLIIVSHSLDLKCSLSPFLCIFSLFFFFLLCHVLLANLCCVLPVCVLCNSSKTKIGFLFVCFLFNQNPIPSHRGNFFFSKKGEFVKLFVLFSLLCFCNLPPINHHQQRKQIVEDDMKELHAFNSSRLEMCPTISELISKRNMPYNK